MQGATADNGHGSSILVRNVLFCLYLLAGLFDNCLLAILMHMCMHLKLCISQTMDSPGDRPLSPTAGASSSNPRLLTQETPPWHHSAEILTRDQADAALDFLAQDRPVLPLDNDSFLPNMGHESNDEAADDTNLIQAVSDAQLKETQEQDVCSPGLPSAAFSPIQLMPAPLSLSSDERDQAESSTAASRDTALMPPPTRKQRDQAESSTAESRDTALMPPPTRTQRAPAEPSTAASQDTARMPPVDGKRGAPAEPSSVASEDTQRAPAEPSTVASQDTAPLPPVDGEKRKHFEPSSVASQDKPPAHPNRNKRAKTKSTAASQETACSPAVAEPPSAHQTPRETQHTSTATTNKILATNKKKVSSKKRAVRASITSPVVTANSSAQPDPVIFVDLVFVCVLF